jgi:hypothetical protein
MHHDDPLQVLEFILHHRKEFHLAQVQLSVTFNVVGGGPPPSPLVVTPPTVIESLTVGTAADGTAVATASGGTPPYTYALDPTSSALPTGVSFAEDGNGNITLAGTPTTAGSSLTPVILNITDSATPPATAKLRTNIGAR